MNGLGDERACGFSVGLYVPEILNVGWIDTILDGLLTFLVIILQIIEKYVTKGFATCYSKVLMS